ncbi:tetratricopeptide repeat protein [Salipaludibacillus sp. CF4.18]|uniref:tetratricopeptide repeat protein n=1 Tax=Salipaludibacillus sp. CF4.18 TaxID=3373081 RepID=UPI003EE7224F
MAEEYMINKTYYRTILDEESLLHPVRSLGHAFFKEQSEKGGNLASLRFAQGEVYYYHKDLEAAIQKWQNVNNELEHWAKKNIGDAYYELGWLGEAETMYTSIKSSDPMLTVEVALQLVSLNEELNNKDRVYQFIRTAMATDPDYPNVTTIARTIYEGKQDWENAVDLAAVEAMRTENLHWFETLIGYVNKGYTSLFAPSYFEHVLVKLYELDESLFSQLTKSLWHQYQESLAYLSWMELVNRIFASLDTTQMTDRRIVLDLHHESYLELMKGNYLVKELRPVLPGLLVNWLNISPENAKLFPATAMLAWNDIFPSTIEQLLLQEAEDIVQRLKTDVSLDDVHELLQSLLNWAETNQINIGFKKEWLISQMTERDKKHLFITGASRRGKSSVMNAILDETLFGEEAFTLFVHSSNDDQAEMIEITEEGSQVVDDITTLTENTLVDLKWPSRHLKELGCSLVSSPDFSQYVTQENDRFEYSNVVDGILYIIDGERPMMDKAILEAETIASKVKHVPVHFVLNNVESVDEEELKQVLKGSLPDAQFYSYSSHRSSDSLVDFINVHFTFKSNTTKQISRAKLLYFIRESLTHLLDQRVSRVKALESNIAFQEEMKESFLELERELVEMREEKSNIITSTYRLEKEELKSKIWREIPVLLSESASEISDDSDYTTLHDDIDVFMNNKIQDYIEINVIPQFQASLQKWMEDTHEEMKETEDFLISKNEWFNDKYKEKKVNLACDFVIFKDWKRDINRMTNRMEIDEVKFMNQLKPTQFLLKSAGKIFGNLQTNNQLLFKQYQKFIENGNFEDVTGTIINKIFLEFDLFEKALKSDLKMSFQESVDKVIDHKEEADFEINKANEKLEEMRKSPEYFHDPLRIFEVRLLQYEMMSE